MGETGGLEQALVRRLHREGRKVVTARFGDRLERTGEGSVTLRPKEADDYRRMLAALQPAEPGVESWAAVHLGNLTGISSPDAGGPRLFDEIQAAGYYSLLFLVQAWAQTGARLHLAAVADGLFDVSGSDPIVPEKAPLAALCKVVPQEHPGILCRCLDVRPSATAAVQEAWEALAGRVLAEVESATPEVFVACRGARRWIESFEPVRLEPTALARRELRPGGVYLLLGGLGGIGLRVAELLARSAGARLVLAGRSPFPPREEWDAWLAGHPGEDRVSRRISRLRNIEALGGKVLVVEADAADAGQVQSAVAAAVGSFGALHGVFHCAGITRGPSLGPLASLGITESEAQFRAKVHGLYALEKALEQALERAPAGRAIDFCYLFSSASAVLGGLGLAAYSAASLFMDAFALCRNAAGRGVWLTSDWDPWPDEEEDDDAQEPRAGNSSVAQYTMTPAESAEALHRVLLHGPEHTLVVTGDLEARVGIWLRGAGREEKSGARHPRSLPTPYVAPRNEAERILAELWQEYLGIEPVGVHDNFFQLGGHSLMGMRLRTALEQTFRVELPMVVILQSPTVAEAAVAIEMALIEMLSGRDDLEEAILGRESGREGA
jgi:NAD(P)-dependent dehydrogenase (short-subunit alcohol dehydrogenase family)/acyl carrier protein